MSEQDVAYATGYSTVISGGSVRMAEPSPISPRVEQVKTLDEALSRLELHVEKLGARLAPAFRQHLAMAVDPSKDRDLTPSESDITAHLRHTVRRVHDITDTLGEFVDRLDI